jgi:hypothetical protein
VNVSDEHTASIFRGEVRRQYVPPKYLIPTSLHSIKTQKTTVNIFITVRTSSHVAMPVNYR